MSSLRGKRLAKEVREAPKALAPEVFTLRKLSWRHHIPMQVSKQALNWWMQFASHEEITEKQLLDGLSFHIPSLGRMSYKAFLKACCSISDVEKVRDLDMEFVGSVLLRTAEYLEGTSDEHLGQYCIKRKL